MQRSNVFEAKPEGFTLVCPGFRGPAMNEGASAGAGCLVFTVGSQLVAELDQGDLIETWAAAEELSAAEAAELTEAAAAHLLDMLEDGIGAVDIAEAVTDAAVVFLLAMRQHGIADPKRIPACTVKWSLASETARVQLAS
ncbi:hypothetical protein [Aestuariivirga sp.]|jgi:hypothetical protein|uniref:hypothetical protein n=1 Tax=Aestuariivirga sp. TaxID=2650926 RepID=UPI003784FADF